MIPFRRYLYYQIYQTHLSLTRSASSSTSEKAAAKKILNSVNKSLFGAVVRQKSKPRPIDTVPEPVFVHNGKDYRAENQSEMYWMLEHKPAATKKRATTLNSKKKTTSAEDDDSPIDIQNKMDKMQKDTIKVLKKRTNVSNKTDDVPKKTVEAHKKSIKSMKIEINKPEADTPTPVVLTQFNDSLCKTPLKLKQITTKNIPKLRNVDDRLREILTVPPFDLDNWCSGVEKRVVGIDLLEVRQMPSVGKVLQATMSEPARKALMQWKLLKIAELGEQGFQELQQSHLTTGTNFHNAIQTYFHTKQIPDAKSTMSSIWTSVETVMTDIDSDPELVESPIVHPVLQYKGIVDCVSKVNGELSVVEWKKSDRVKNTISSTFDAPLQLCAYLGAINADPRYSLKVHNGLVVVAYTSGEPANAFRLDEKSVQKYWQAWLKRLHEYWVRHRDGTLPEPI